MRFVHPELLWALLALPLLALVSWWALRRRRRALIEFAGGRENVKRFDGQVCPNRRATKLILVYAALATLITAAARPQWGVRLEEVSRAGIDLVVLLDTSLSMAATDVAPSRLGLARHAVDTLLRKLDGDRVALVTFAGQASLECPLTLDHAAVRLFLDAVDVESVPIGGTALAEALKLAVSAFGEAEQIDIGTRSRAILLLTDGEDHEGGTEETVSLLEGQGVALYAMGVGTTRGAPIPLLTGSGRSKGYKKDREGRVVTTRLDETALEQLALATGGRYARATASQVELDDIAGGLKSMEQGEFGEVLRARYEERFQFPLALGLLVLIAETLLGDRRGVRQKKEGSA